MILETIAGSILGLLGTGLTTYSNYKMEQLRNDMAKDERAHELAKIKAESDAAIAEIQANIQIAKTKVQGEVDLSEAEAFRESQKKANSTKPLLPSTWVETLMGQTGAIRYFTIPIAVCLIVMFGLVDAIKEAMRSILTIYALGMATWVTWEALVILEKCGIDKMDCTQALTTWNESVNIIMLLMTTMVTWWFGDRRMAKHMMHLKDNTKK